MTDSPIRFDDGAAYERMMGVWSRLVGEVFLDWLSPPTGQRWIDVGCGNGAFTELVAERCEPSMILGIDPSEGQLSFARSRHTAGVARFQLGEAMALPCDDASFDAAVMALVIFFVPDPAQGVAEMKRVVRPGGAVSAYVWDVLEPGGFPLQPVHEVISAMGGKPALPPRSDVSRSGPLRDLWTDAGLKDVKVREITVSRTFKDFDDLWASAQIAIGMSPSLREMSAEETRRFQDRLRVRLPASASGRITYASRANAVTGVAPA
jgi:SAM-dependent methyltransferase